MLTNISVSYCFICLLHLANEKVTKTPHVAALGLTRVRTVLHIEELGCSMRGLPCTQQNLQLVPAPVSEGANDGAQQAVSGLVQP